ncbi:hypothetical protein APHAL10511_000517 [Amanita phalloides]|nr:hypothetical protein APHAL10511_000517 [Amanita phalloides]
MARASTGGCDVQSWDAWRDSVGLDDARMGEKMSVQEAQKLAENLYASTKVWNMHRVDMFEHKFWFGGSESYYVFELEDNPNSDARAQVRGDVCARCTTRIGIAVQVANLWTRAVCVYARHGCPPPPTGAHDFVGPS